MMRKAYLLAALLTGCAMAPPVPITTRFDEASHAIYRTTGTAMIKGQAFLRQQGGGIVTCAGSNVILMPATPYFREVVSIGRTGRTPEQPGRGFKEFGRVSQCDAQGNFAFSNLPDATWIVITNVSWAVGYNQQGGALTREVSSKAGETIQVLLTDKERL